MMRIIFTDLHDRHDCAGEMKDGQLAPCFENPRRLMAIADALRAAGHHDFETPPDKGLAPILAVNDLDYVEFLQSAHAQWRAAGRAGDILPLCWPGPYMRREVAPSTIDGQVGLYAFDSGTPICAGTWEAAYQGAQGAVAAADAVAGGARTAFLATRPPGHHAMPGQYGGYCFLATAAIAAQRLLDHGAEKVAVLDIDYHHGNGTQTIFYERNDVLVVNVHADPRTEYPYFLGHADEKGARRGEDANLNLPLAKGADWASYQPALQEGLAAIARFGADSLVLSFGADTYVDDPLGRFRLVTNDYARAGQAIAGLKLPCAVVMEGGYHIEALGANVVSLLQGLES